MDSIDECRIDCEFIKNEKKRDLLEQRFEDLNKYKKEKG